MPLWQSWPFPATRFQDRWQCCYMVMVCFWRQSFAMPGCWKGGFSRQTIVKLSSKCETNFSWIYRKLGKECQFPFGSICCCDLNIWSWVHHNKQLVALIFRSGSIKWLLQKRLQRDDVIIRMPAKYQIMENTLIYSPNSFILHFVTFCFLLLHFSFAPF